MVASLGLAVVLSGAFGVGAAFANSGDSHGHSKRSNSNFAHKAARGSLYDKNKHKK